MAIPDCERIAGKLGVIGPNLRIYVLLVKRPQEGGDRSWGAARRSRECCQFVHESIGGGFEV
jgi:hypothetical protein